MIEEIKQIILKHSYEAKYGIYFSRNEFGDNMTNLYDKNGIVVDICYDCGYFEVLGLSAAQQYDIREFYKSI